MEIELSMPLVEGLETYMRIVREQDLLYLRTIQADTSQSFQLGLKVQRAGFTGFRNSSKEFILGRSSPTVFGQIEFRDRLFFCFFEILHFTASVKASSQACRLFREMSTKRIWRDHATRVEDCRVGSTGLDAKQD